MEEPRIQGHGEKLSRKQEEAILALLTHSSIKAAAEAIQVERHTLGRWLRDPEFNSAFRQASTTVLEDVTLKLQHNASGAADLLLKFFESEDEKLRFHAVRYLLDRVLAWREATILEDELTATQLRLEARGLTEPGGPPPPW